MFRKLVLALVLIGLLGQVAYASSYHHKKVVVNNITNVDGGDDVPGIEGGVGLDVKLYDFNKGEKANKFLDSVNFEARKDLVDLDRNSFYLVLTTDLTK